MSWFSWLTGGSDTVDKVIDNVSSGLDMAFFTDEEKSIASQKILDWKLEYAKASAGQSISRRIIASIVSGLWGFIVLCAAIAGYFNAGADGWAAYLIKLLDTTVNQPFMIIIGFYFLAHIVGKIGKS